MTGQPGQPGTTGRVDAHHHVWDLSVRPQTWMVAAQHQPIWRSFDLDELRPQAAALGVTASVVVQSVGVAAETAELLALAGPDPLVSAVVGWVDLTRPGAADRVAELRAGPGGHRLRGVRHQVHDEPDPGWLCRDDVRRGLAEIGAAGLVYDLLVRAEQLPASLATVRALPDQLFVVDHAAKPQIASGATDLAVNDGWRAGLLALAAEPNVVCKLSGLLVEARWQGWRPDDVLPYAEFVLEAFGPHRVMIGSDWPVCLLAGTYQQSLTVYDGAVARLGPSEQWQVLAGTAARVYHLEP